MLKQKYTLINTASGYSPIVKLWMLHTALLIPHNTKQNRFLLMFIIVPVSEIAAINQ
jgi:hypothetical protein